MIYSNLFSAVIVSFVTAFCAIPLLIRLAPLIGAIDQPDGKLKQQKVPVAYLGGLGVYIGFITSTLLLSLWHEHIVFFIIGSTVLLLVGLVDDFFILAPSQKFLAQIAAAIFFLKGGYYIKATFLSNYLNLGISLFWILSIINAFNLIDVMDGLAATVAIGVCGTFLGISLLLGNMEIALILSCFLGAILAFFWYNKPPARIYLGDAGSHFIGGFLATIPFAISWSELNPWGFFVPVAVLAIPSLELLSLMVIRTYKGIPFYQGSRDHFCHYLLNKGWSKQYILWYLLLLSLFIFVVVNLFLSNIICLWQFLCFGGAFFGFWISNLVY